MACFDHHRAEITVMQFTGHPLLVHQFVTVPWDFNPVPYCQLSSPMPTEYATSDVFRIACLVGSEVNIQQMLICSSPMGKCCNYPPCWPCHVESKPSLVVHIYIYIYIILIRRVSKTLDLKNKEKSTEAFISIV